MAERARRGCAHFRHLRGGLQPTRRLHGRRFRTDAPVPPLLDRLEVLRSTDPRRHLDRRTPRLRDRRTTTGALDAFRRPGPCRRRTDSGTIRSRRDARALVIRSGAGRPPCRRRPADQRAVPRRAMSGAGHRARDLGVRAQQTADRTGGPVAHRMAQCTGITNRRGRRRAV